MFGRLGNTTGGTRKASHAGSWYTDDRRALEQQLSQWIEETGMVQQEEAVRGLIGPHAGYSYSGPTAAHAYAPINPHAVERVFILGPSHAWYVASCALPEATTYETPLGSLEVDTEVVSRLRETGRFAQFEIGRDEREHSMELHLPFIKHRIQHKEVKIVPILVGSIDPATEREFGQLLAEYTTDPTNLFVISSDFCHWGDRFDYQPTSGREPIHETISQLDHDGIELIEKLDTDSFTSYLQRTQNTICGRHPISVYMHALNASGMAWDVKFVKYAQSSQVKSKRDSSVSYASAVVTERK